MISTAVRHTIIRVRPELDKVGPVGCLVCGGLGGPGAAGQWPLTATAVPTTVPVAKSQDSRVAAAATSTFCKGVATCKSRLCRDICGHKIQG